ncbi:MAG TPA: carboxypeptidase-like regulatory domain-containing protein [Vicinamibacterales bacterium]|nr:carboxypeptidase-like regulatory domain-containing protein [Vicinamibacterales bacterium]
MTQRIGFTFLLALAIGGTQATGSGQVMVSSQTMEIRGDATILGGTGKPMDIGSGVIAGRVVEADGRSTVAGTIVTLSQAGFTPLRALSDGQGRFAFRALPKGLFSLTATRPGFVDGAYGRMRPGGTPLSLELTENLRTGDADIMIWRYAAIAGTVLDEHNEPLVGAPVRVLRRDYVSGRRRLTESGSDSTDDRGQFRVGSLEPGDYIVVLPMTQRPSLDSLLRGLEQRIGAEGGASGMGAAFEVRATATAAAGSPLMITSSTGGSSVPPAGTTEDGMPMTYQTEFYPGALSASRATAVTLAAGEEFTAADFRLTPVRALSLSGVVTGPEGPAANAQLQLIPADAGDLVSPIEAATTSTDNNGQFAFTGVPSGQYVLRAQRSPRFAGAPGQSITVTRTSGGDNMQFVTTRQVMDARGGGPPAPLPTEPTLWAEVPVSLGTRALAALAIPLREGLKISGTVTFQGSAAQPAPEARGSINISLEPADGRSADLASIARGRVDPNGTFATMGVPAGKYILRVSGAPQGWTLRSATFAGRDITETAIELKDDSAAGVVLTFTDRPSEMKGTVRTASGNPDPTASVIVFPVDQAGWVDTGSQPRRIKTSRTGKDGSFTIGPLPPGDYNVVAIEDSAPRNWQDPAYLDAIARGATTVRIGEGDSRAVTLTSTKGPA